MTGFTRRSFLAASAAGIAASQIGPADAAEAAEATAAPPHTIGEIRTVTQFRDRYHGWPTLARTRDGELLLVCSGGRDAHVCPLGRVELMTSSDDGQTWSLSRTLVDGLIDDRDAGVLETAEGTWLVSTFSSLAYVPTLEAANAAAAAGESHWLSGDRLERWNAAHRRVAQGPHEAQLGCWMLRSEDRGVSWSAPYRVPVNSPHGPVLLRSGRLLYPGIGLWDADRPYAVYSSDDDGKTWQLLANLPVRAGDQSSQYHELHAVEAADGTLIVQIRNHNRQHTNETLQTESTDGGKSWTEPHSIGVWGLPSHLLRLSDGRLVMTYGHRRAPLGNQARVSDDHGKTWSAPILLQDDATSGDLGYPSTVEIAPGKLVTAWYEVVKGNSMSQLRLVEWEFSGG